MEAAGTQGQVSLDLISVRLGSGVHLLSIGSIQSKPETTQPAIKLNMAKGV